MTQRHQDFANQLASAGGVDVLYMGVFDSDAGFFLEHWVGSKAPHDPSELSRLTEKMKEVLGPRGSHPDLAPQGTGQIKTKRFRVSIGKPRGHLYPVVAVHGWADPDNDTSFDAFWPVAMSFVAGHLEDLAGQKKRKSRHLKEAALRALSVHFAVVDSNGGIDCYANLSNDWLAEHGGFEIDRERLVARSDETQRAFLAALRLATGPEGESSIVSLRNDGGRVKLVWVSRLEEADEPRALVILSRGRENTALSERLLKLSGLTVAERRVADHVLQGKSLMETAQETNLALSTVRSYMKRILAKTSTHRQSQFVSHYQEALARIAIAPSEDGQRKRR